MGADPDVAELHLSIRDYFTRQPYIDSSGITTLDMPYEAIEVTDVMYEAKVNEISTAKITLPSLIAFPGLRPLLQQIKEGNRVEIFNFQPDCGDPVFAGFIPPNGIEEQDGKVILTVEDTLGQLKWQHLKRFEYLSAPASGLYDRARSTWVDVVNEDFLGTNPAGDYSIAQGSGPFTWGAGFVMATAPSNGYLYPTGQLNAVVPVPGDTWIFEADATLSTDFSNPMANGAEITLGLFKPGTSLGVLGDLHYTASGIAGFPDAQLCDASVVPSVGTPYNAANQSSLVSIPMPQSHHLSVFIHFNTGGTVGVYVYLDNINLSVLVWSWPFDATQFTPFLGLNVGGGVTPATATVTSWRVSKLAPALIRAARFNPQTIDAVTYQPNNEDNFQFLQLVAEKDGAEYRPIYHSWPQQDELELDATATLGKFASRVLGYEQPSALPTDGSPQVSPAPVITDLAAFLTAPPFRLEEGYNLEAAPRILPRASGHANDVIRLGSSTADSQVFGEKWSAAELGRPQHTPNGALYPRFEQITNDDRVGIQSLVASLASLELTRRVDPTSSLELQVVDEVPWAFRWRAGDQVFVKTQSLRTNLEQEMRVQRVKYRAGSPVRTVTVGKTDFDPTMLRMLAEDTKMSWLYDQSGTNPGIYVYPSLGNIASGATSPVFSIPLDQYTTGSALVYAALHWFADTNVLKIKPLVNGASIGLPNTSPSLTDSGLVICTACFQGIGTYQLAFNNTDSVARNLTGAFLVLRIKA